MSEAEELLKLCEPLRIWLAQNHGTCTGIHITQEEISLEEKTLVIPIKKNQ